jgi:hypothetical protein
VREIGIVEEMVEVAPAVVDRLAEYFADVASVECPGFDGDLVCRSCE